LLSVTSLLLAYLLAVPMGLFATVRSGRMDERVLSTVLYMLYSIPAFVTALLLLNLFYVRLEGTPFQLPLGGMTSMQYDQLTAAGKVWDRLLHMILPVTCATYAGLAYYSRFVKSNMEEVIRQDYIRTARAKGVGPFRVIVKHAFRNTLIPFVTLMGLTLPGLLSGFVILESIFTWQGMGLLFLDSITNRDYPTIMGLTFMFSVLTLGGQLIADILYAFVDPRVTYS
jgi:peptide/nickel transport system permease protein